MRTAIISCLVLLLGTAQATGTMEAGPLVVRIDNGHETGCLEELTGLCLAAVQAEDASSAEVDARQRVQYVGIGLNETYRSAVNDLTGYELLPARDLLVIDASAVFLPHNAFQVLAENVGTFAAPAGVVVVYFGEDGWGWGYLGPGLNPVDLTIQPQRAHYAYTSGGNDYNGTGGFHEIFAEADSDAVVSGWLVGPCQTVNNSQCAEYASAAAEHVNNTTPRIATELVVYEAEVSGSSASLRTAFADPPKGSADDISPRKPASPPANWPMGQQENTLAASPLGGLDSSASEMPHLVPTPIESHVAIAPLVPDPVVVDEPPVPLLAYVAGLAIAVAIAALYSRLKDRNEALHSLRRTQILNALKASGACTVAEVARILGIDWSTALYHVRVLERNGHLALRAEASAVVVHLPGQSAESPQGGPAWKRIIAIIRAHGGRVLRDDLHRLASDIPLRTRNHALRLLATKNLIVEVQADSGPEVSLAP